MATVFLSYRRSDNPDAAGRIYDRLTAHFGHQSVFFDIDSIPFGVDFRAHINDMVGKCDVVLVVMGEKWLDPRLQDPNDFVRLEVETALRRDIPVIPVPVGGASVPAAEDLPPTMRELSFRNAAEVRSGTAFPGHMDRLIRGIESIVGKAVPPRSGAPRALARTKAAALIAAVLIAVVVFGPFGGGGGSEVVGVQVATASGVPVGPQGLEMEPGERLELRASLTGNDGGSVEGLVEWISSAPDVVSVSGGLLEAGVPGVAIVRAAAGEIQQSVSVSVSTPESLEPGGPGNVASSNQPADAGSDAEVDVPEGSGPAATEVAPTLPPVPQPDPGPVAPVETPDPEPSPLEDGVLALTILPWGELYVDDVQIDDEATGTLLETLEPGIHVLRVFNPALDVEEVREIDVPPGDTLRIEINLFQAAQ